MTRDISAAYDYVKSVIHTAHETTPYAWHGWALREAFLAGISYAQKTPNKPEKQMSDDELEEIYYAATDGLGVDFERELRAIINPAYEDTRGTESYERKRLLGEIDRLRNVLNEIQDKTRHFLPTGYETSALEDLAHHIYLMARQQ